MPLYLKFCVVILLTAQPVKGVFEQLQNLFKNYLIEPLIMKYFIKKQAVILAHMKPF